MLWSLALACIAAPALAWGPDGHRTIGTIADQLIAGSKAAPPVAVLLGGVGLADATVWADCAKGVDPAQDYAYTAAGRYPECAIFETPAGEAEMSDFVRRNDTNCDRQPGEESCHKQYHYTDVAIQRNRYAAGLAGTRDDDIVGVVAAAARVLRGEAAPPPFKIKDRREALLLLAHFVGDIHQPLHVGAIYLDAAGKRVDPDATGYDAATDTRGGNQLIVVTAGANARGVNLHHEWDVVPASMTASRVDDAWLTQARAVKSTRGDVANWSALWATDTLWQARLGFGGIKFGAKSGSEWSATLPGAYDNTMNTIKQRQLTKAGARLAQLLQAVWP